MASSREFFDLYVRTKPRFFRAADADAFEDCLRRRAAAMQLRSLTSPQELQLDGEGRTLRGGMRLSASAFKRVAGMLATGAHLLFPELAGVIRTRRNDGDLVDGRMTRQFWNALVELRFQHVARYRLLCDTDDGTIDGLAKASYVPPINHDVYAAAVDAFGGAYAFYAAYVVGRSVAIWFRQGKPFQQVAGLAFYRGYYVAAGELAGFANRATPAVFFPSGICLAPFADYGCKIKTVGTDEGSARAAKGFAAVLEQGFPDDVVGHGRPLLDSQLLGFLPTADAVAQEEELGRITEGLCRLGMTRADAKAVAAAALAVGRDATNPGAAELRAITTTYSSRTLLDLLVPLCQRARQMPLRQREIVEQAAFAVLTGGFSTSLLGGRHDAAQLTRPESQTEGQSDGSAG